MNLLDYNLNDLSNDQTLVSKSQYADLLTQMDQWNVVQKDGVDQLFCV